MGSSLPTPASVPQDSSTLHDQHSLADKRLLHEKDGSPVELAHITSHGAKVELGDAQSQATTMLGTSRCLKGKEKEWTLPVRRKGPLRLLDLPVDILKMIIKEVPHTNDLTSLTLTHSALHNLTTPHIYSRFDIVWPDSNATPEPRTGVDALTYGLATLAMGQEGFGEPHWNQPKRSLPAVQHFTCKECGATNHVERSETPVHPRKRRRGNNYAHYTRKFSLGNGPSDLVQEYLITKEGGKMLGTLVALAVARMLNLESFAWDMPTGILRDVWLALSSLGERADGEACRLERIWVRWHDNVDDLMLPRATLVNSAFPSSHPPPPAGAITLAGVVPSQMVTGDDGSTPEGHHQSPLSISQNRVERPTFSVLPPLKSLSVLDIDELAYLDEMRVLIGRSQQRLRELRVGIALQAEKRAWVAPPAGEENQWEGVLGTLMRNVYDMRKHMRPESFKNDRAVTLRSACVNVLDGTKLEEAAPGEFSSFGAGHDAKTSEGRDGPGSSGRPADIGDVVEAEQSKMTPEVDDGSESSPLPPRVSTLLNDADYIVSIESHLATSYPISTSDPDSGVLPPDESGRITKVIEDDTRHATIDDRYQALSTEGHLDTVSCASLLRQSPFSGKLALETLELERVPLAAPVVHIAFDWSMITSLTILHCPDHEQLWKSLRRAYAPRRSHTSTTILHSTAPSTPSRRKSTANLSNVGGSEYRMNLKRLHTNAVSPSLINFLKDTLAPNSLEWLFLQEGRPYASSVTMDAIYRGPLKRHKGSLKKLLIDSSDRTRDGRATSNARWRKWIFNREILSFVLGGKMSALRELGMALDYRDWHYFLQRLPTIPHLRSLYISYILNYIHLDPRELALQIVDIVALRPEIEICYIGISSKCFEVLENKRLTERHASHDTSTNAANAGPGGIDPDDPSDSDEDDDEEDVDDEDEDANEATTTTATAADAQETDSDASSEEDDSDNEEEENGAIGDKQRPRLKLREILFYDDKVSIFKARHGRL